jgi:hypothetical protein
MQSVPDYLARRGAIASFAGICGSHRALHRRVRGSKDSRKRTCIITAAARDLLFSIRHPMGQSRMSRKTVNPGPKPAKRSDEAALDQAPEEPTAPAPALDAEIKPRPPDLPPEPRPQAEPDPDIPNRPSRDDRSSAKPRIRVPRLPQR